MEQEIWKDIPGYEGLYQASNLGQIKSLDRKVEYTINGKHYSYFKRGRIIHNIMSTPGYYNVGLSKGNKYYTLIAHRLLAKTFIPNPENKPQVNHKNGIKTDNRIDNLEWASSKENMAHSVQNNLRPLGEKCYNTKLTNKEVENVRCLFKDFSARELANKFNTTYEIIRRILTGEKWKSLYYPEDQKIFNKKKLKMRDNVKLTVEDIKNIRRLKDKRPIKIIAKFYNVSRPTVSMILNNKIWKGIEA